MPLYVHLVALCEVLVADRKLHCFCDKHYSSQTICLLIYFHLILQRTVMKTKNTSSLSFPLSFMVVLVSLSWFFYGTILGDYYIMVRHKNGLSVVGLKVILSTYIRCSLFIRIVKMIPSFIQILLLVLQQR